MKALAQRFLKARGYSVYRDVPRDLANPLGVEHAAHAALLRAVLQRARVSSVLDVGAHRGGFRDQLRAAGYGGQGIRANTLVLGSMATEDYDHQAYLQGLPSRPSGIGVRSHDVEKIPLGRRGTPEEVASACVFLSSEDSSYLTGQTIHLNGGLYMA